MKKTIIIIGALALLAVFGTAIAEDKEEKKDKVESQCPQTLIVDQDKCLNCHTSPSFKLKEAFRDEGFEYPNRCTSIIFEGDKQIGRFYLTDIDDVHVSEAFHYFAQHDIRHVIMEIHSPGGSLFDATRIVGIMRSWQSRGIVVETRVHGFALSAGFFIMANGTQGHRYTNSHSELMWHELMSFAMFSVETPSDKEEASRVLRHLQNTVNLRLAEVSNLSKHQIDEKIRKREFWMSGSQAVEYGFADKLMD